MRRTELPLDEVDDVILGQCYPNGEAPAIGRVAALAAEQSGAFAEEIVPVAVTVRGESTDVDRDEHPRADTTLERLAKLRPMLAGNDPDATVTAGNSSGQNDAAAVCIVTHPQRAR